MNEENDNRSISKLNSGFPSYLDFGKLRSEGIGYLGELSGKIWTDHNVHDPGITILEVLCYALIDLGYRTNIPVNDLLAAPDEKTEEPGNYFSPAQILANNPLTITDFRKLLIDIDEVNNAWLEVATDISSDALCTGEEQPQDPILLRAMVTHMDNRKPKDCCDSYLNGIYRVYVDLDQNLDKVFANDPAGRKDHEDKMKKKISGVLAAHRNLCEDFLEPILLDKTEIGICANIELEDYADTDAVYLALTERLGDFLSPVPKFYTLPQLLNDKKKSIEEIFSGRPLISKSSHGFLDTGELENLPRRKVIHVSDIYNELLQVGGVKTVRSVSIRSCPEITATANKDRKWKYIIPKDHIPVFSTACSGFNFYKKGVAVLFEPAKHEYFLQMRRDGNAKVPYKVPSPYLDLALEKGNYRKGINDYYSIQHDFPKVYGIAKGALPSDVSDARKAQALQLKGYLLFFDQLLANYVAQLSEVRKLFAFKNGEDNQRSYFSAIPESVPDLGQLLRFNSSAQQQGKQILAYPVSLSRLNEFIKNDLLKKADINKDFPSIDFASATENSLAMALMQSDFMNDTMKPFIISKGEKCFYYYLLGSSSELALVGKRYYESEREAMDKASELLYTGKFEESYSAFSMSHGSRYTFDIETDLSSYGRYLEMITENKELFKQRRHQFLDHLLSRFAESFTEFAILNFKNTSVDDDRLNSMAENLLSVYPELSSNRGRAYDYRLNGWNNENLSGLEKKFRALSGINNMLRKSLCHFEVFKHEKQFLYKLELADQKLFYSDEKFGSPEEAASAAAKLFTSLSDPGSYEALAIPEQPELYRLNIHLPGLQPAYSFSKYPDEASAKGAVDLYAKAFSGKAEESLVYTCRFKYQATLRNDKGDILQTLTEEPDSREKAEKISVRSINSIKHWSLKGDPVHGRLIAFDKDGSHLYFIDTDTFKADINNTIIGKPELFTYDILDKGNRFKFSSLKEFATDKAAKEDYQHLILMMANENNIRVDEEEKDSYSINVWQNGEKVAKYAKEFQSLRKAEDTRDVVIRVMKEYSYHVEVAELPDRYNFRFVLGTEPGKEMGFEYVAEDFPQPGEALKKAQAFRNMIGGMELKEIGDELFLVQGKAKNITMAKFTGDLPSKEMVEKAGKELSLLKSIDELKPAKGPEAFRFAARQDELSDCGEYGYRLVDNDHMLAFSLPEGKLNNPASAEKYIKDLLKRYATGYQWLRICMGGDIIREQKVKAAKTSWFHYQVKTLDKISNYNNTASEIIVLFESVQGYASREDAEKAFAANIYEILQHAEHLENYGSGEYISDREIVINAVPGDCSPTGSVVYMPSKTISFLGSYPDEAFRRMVTMAESFPVKLIYPESSEEERVKYNGMFPCSPVDKNDDEDCGKDKGRPQYYFILSQDNEAVWQSMRSYDSAHEAQLGFDFFYILLGYYGNYKITCDPCSQRYTVFIREVLAESTRRYDEESAWGVTGIEQFICTAQSNDAFHHYMDKKSCHHHFYVACSNTPLIHPCIYETPLLRDRAMNRLRQAAEKIGFKWPEIITENGEKILLDIEGNRIAKIKWENGRRIFSKDCEDERVEIFHLMLTRELEEYEGKLRIEINDGEWLSFSPLFNDIEKSDAFRKKLVCTALYFPIVIRESVTNGRLQRKFCLEIRFPGIRDCYEGGYRKDPCDCEDDFPGDDCDIAWKSDCCFNTCDEAMAHFRRHMELLLDYRNYRAIDDCPCGPYRIALHEWPGVKDCREQTIKPGWIIAYNPQRYPSPEMACDAIVRAKGLINDEGLHLAEHILLRPQTEDECQCAKGQRRGEGEGAGNTGCDFRWPEPGDPDVCIDPSEVCFVPGEDPFSFIATIVLPAWPERYRSEDNREIIETLLRREAPAHVLLRILWLTPHDLCRFETMFRKWQLSLADKTMCSDAFDYCAFLEFLFHYRWESLAGCTSCKPCDEPAKELPCEEVRAVERYRPKKFLSDTNQLFEWRNQLSMLMAKVLPAKTIATPAMEITLLPIPMEAPMAAALAIEPEKEIDAIIKKPKRAFVNQRRTARKEKITELQAELKKMDVVGEVSSFLDDTNPDAARMEKITAKLLTKIKTVKGKKPALNKKHALSLMELAVHHYLDKQVFNGRDLKKINAIAGSLAKTKQAGLDIVKIYMEWQPAEVLKYEPGLPGEEIRKLFLDKSLGS